LSFSERSSEATAAITAASHRPAPNES
jgi:hypothetical protein